MWFFEDCGDDFCLHCRTSGVALEGLRLAGSVSGWSLIKPICKLLNSVFIVWVANISADMLANLGCEHDSQLVVYENPPMQLTHVLLSDVMGVPCLITI